MCRPNGSESQSPTHKTTMIIGDYCPNCRAKGRSANDHNQQEERCDQSALQAKDESQKLPLKKKLLTVKKFLSPTKGRSSSAKSDPPTTLASEASKPKKNNSSKGKGKAQGTRPEESMQTAPRTSVDRHNQQPGPSNNTKASRSSQDSNKTNRSKDSLRRGSNERPRVPQVVITPASRRTSTEQTRPRESLKPLLGTIENKSL